MYAARMGKEQSKAFMLAKIECFLHNYFSDPFFIHYICVCRRRVCIEHTQGLARETISSRLLCFFPVNSAHEIQCEVVWCEYARSLTVY